MPDNRRGRSRTLGLALIRGLLSPLSYAPVSGAEGTRTLTCRIKSPVCCHYTTTPYWSGVSVSIAFASCPCSWCPVVALRVELSATRLSAGFGQPALDYHLPTSMSAKSGWQDSNLRLRAPKARGFAATLHPVIQSERPELNRRSPGPRPGAITRLRYVLLSVARAGVEPASAP